MNTKKLSLKAQKARAERLFFNGAPRYIRCYDYGGETLDRYTIVFTKKRVAKTTTSQGEFMYIGASSNPMGFYQHGFSKNEPCDRKPSYGHLGKKITFCKLPQDLKDAIINEYNDLWNIA
jgi:hypothetical protein